MSLADDLIPTNRAHRAHKAVWWGFAFVLATATCVVFSLYEFGHRPLQPAGGIYFLGRHELPVDLYLQGDPRWGQNQIAASVHNIAQVGCAITSTAMVMKFYGIDTDPGRLNTFLQTHGGYDENNDLRWEGPPAMQPTRFRHVYEDLPSYYLIDSNLLRGNPVIVRLHLPGGPTHFVVIMGKEGFQYLVRDPSSAGLRKGVYPLRELGSKIEALRFYQKLDPAS